MRDDPSFSEYKSRWGGLYRGLNQERGLAGYFLRKSHEWTERAFDSDDEFPAVLEVGAGDGIHLQAVRHRYSSYTLTDLEPPEVAQAGVTVAKEDATRLSFPDHTFDRLIATHVLEHLLNPHQVLREWNRVVKPGGVLSILLPCDPGLAWRLGRALGSRRRFVRAGIDYDYWMAREHVNAIGNLVALIRYYFQALDESWLPCRVPSSDLNLFYVAHVRTAATT